VGRDEPFLHRSGAKSGDSKNNSKQGLPPPERILDRNQIFDQQRETTAVFSMELRIRSDPWEILRQGGVEKVRKWHIGCGEAGYCGICFDKAG
jgi:hypothetical protein